MMSEAEGHGQMEYPAAILQTPASFTFNSPDEWLKLKRRFEQYRVTSGLDKDDEHQVVRFTMSKNTLSFKLYGD